MDMEYSIQRLLENVIKRSLFPRTTINVYIQVICDDGSISFYLQFGVSFMTLICCYIEFCDVGLG